MKPIDPEKTAPTYPDIEMFVEGMLDVERWNDDNLRRRPQLPQVVERLLNIIYKFVEGGK